MLPFIYCCRNHNAGEIPGSINQLLNLTELWLATMYDDNKFSGMKFAGSMHAAWQLLISHHFLFSFQAAMNISRTSRGCRHCGLMASGINLRISQLRSLRGVSIFRWSWSICGTGSRPSLTHWCRSKMNKWISQIINRREARANAVKMYQFALSK